MGKSASKTPAVTGKTAKSTGVAVPKAKAATRRPKSVSAEPAATEPAVANSASAKPSSVVPAEAKATKAKPGKAKPAAIKSVKAKSAAAKTAKAKPAAGKPAAAVKPGKAKPVAAEVPDNLKQVKGIGPQNEAKLNGIGVNSFAQIAAWTKKEQAEIGERLAFPGRIEREDWVGQAKVLAKGGKTDFAKRVARGEVASSAGATPKRGTGKSS